jgi:hypothetical protein
VAQIGALGLAQEIAAFHDLLADIMARVSNYGASEQGEAQYNGLSEAHFRGGGNSRPSLASGEGQVWAERDCSRRL